MHAPWQWLTLPSAYCAGGEDLFVHQTAIQTEGFRSLREGEPVEFYIETSADGRQKAIAVTGPNGANPEVRGSCAIPTGCLSGAYVWHQGVRHAQCPKRAELCSVRLCVSRASLD